MAIYIHCPHCNVRLEEMHPECAHCGRRLPPGVLAALSCALGESGAPTADLTPWHPQAPRAFAPSFSAQLMAADRTVTACHSPLRPWLAAILSLLWGGGQLYNGQTRKGVVLLGCGVIAVLSWPLLLGKIFACCLWLYAMADAYMVARRMI